MTPNKKPEPTKINVELPPDLEATYANLVLISHTPSEYILDFARILPNVPKAKVHARILMTPMNAKLLYRALGENLARYEAQYGEIETHQHNITLDPKKGFST